MPSPAHPSPKVRAVRHHFPDDLPRHYHAGNALLTHLSNGVNLLFPIGERFFIRSVKRYADRLSHKDEIRAFFGQEGSHAREHERFFQILRGQGYEIDTFLTEFEAAIRFIEEHSPGALNLAATAATEHFTAVMAADVFADRAMLERALPPEVASLFLWHAAEEIEHKAVAFDALGEIAPGYHWRVAGFVLASAMFFYWWRRATLMLCAQEGLSRQELAKLRREAKEMRPRSISDGLLLRGALRYLRPGFHPWDSDEFAQEAAEYLRSGALPLVSR